MVQRGSSLRLMLKALQPLGILSNIRGKNFDRHLALQRRVTCTEYFTHTARANQRDDFIRTDLGAGSDLLVEKAKRRMLQEAARLRVHREQLLHQLPQHWITLPYLIQVRTPILRLERQRGLEQLLHGLSLRSHCPQRIP